jgi:hypothetical protein
VEEVKVKATPKKVKPMLLITDYYVGFDDEMEAGYRILLSDPKKKRVWKFGVRAWREEERRSNRPFRRRLVCACFEHDGRGPSRRMGAKANKGWEEFVFRWHARRKESALRL